MSTPTFELPVSMRDRIIEHARVETPRECCGIISGRNGTLLELIPMTNTYDGIDFYEIDGKDLYRLYTSLDERGEEIAAIYHSHPVSVAYPSARDIQYAGWPDAVYIICSLEHPEAPVTRAFRIVEETITELEIVATSA